MHTTGSFLFLFIDTFLSLSTYFRCVHSVSDAYRVAKADFSSLESTSKRSAGHGKHNTDLIVLVGQAGSGVSILAANLTSQLRASATDAAASFQHLSVDFAELAPTVDVNRFLDQRLLQAKATNNTGAGKHVIFVSIVQSAAQYFPMQSLLALVAVKLAVAPSVVISMLVPSSLDPLSHNYK